MERKNLTTTTLMVHLNTEETAYIRQMLLEQIADDKDFSEIPCKGLIFVFLGQRKTHFEKEYTGVEWLGQKESFLKPHIEINDLECVGTYDKDGCPVTTDLDIQALSTFRDEDKATICIRTRPKGISVQYKILPILPGGRNRTRVPAA